MSGEERADQGIGPATELGPSNAVVRAVDKAVDKLEIARGYIEADLKQNRDDIRDLRDRMARLETKVADLPSKVWIGVVVLGGMGFLSGLVAVLASVFTHLKP